MRKNFQYFEYGEQITLDVGLNLVLKMIRYTEINRILIDEQEKYLEVIQNPIFTKNKTYRFMYIIFYWF